VVTQWAATVLSAVGAIVALLVWTSPARPPLDSSGSSTATGAGAGAADGRRPRGQRWGPGRTRALLAVGAGAGGAVFVGGRAGLVAGVLAAAAAWWVLARVEPAHVVRHRERVREELPHVVGLFAATLRAGQDPLTGLDAACRALPGPAAESLGPVLARAELGDRERAWAEIAADPVLGRLGRTLARAHETGSPVTTAVERLADELQADQRALVEDRARRVGVLAALPLGVCLLPAFMLLGIVPTVAAMLGTLAG
jgi:Flp pilus assembly protein TadB